MGDRENGDSHAEVFCVPGTVWRVRRRVTWPLTVAGGRFHPHFVGTGAGHRELSSVLAVTQVWLLRARAAVGG